nr:helix-turn-helix transcriptional regulator [uncultured Albidiferax sp.]
MTIGTRLREERNRLSVNQTHLGQRGGVTKNAQMNYENGSRIPNATYLAKVAECGVDVLYVITGKHNLSATGTLLLDPRLQTVFDNYDAASEANKQIIEGVARLAALAAASTH